MQNIRRKYPGLKIIFLTLSEEKEPLLTAIKVGATGYLSKSISADYLTKAIDLIIRGDTVVSPPMAIDILTEFAAWEARLKRMQGSLLSQREKDVLILISRGMSNREVAEKLFISENTVKVHLGKIMGKLDFRSRHQLAAYAFEKGIVSSNGGKLPSIETEDKDSTAAL
jgi:two-component system NarL family response regulator